MRSVMPLARVALVLSVLFLVPLVPAAAEAPLPLEAEQALVAAAEAARALGLETLALHTLGTEVHLEAADGSGAWVLYAEALDASRSHVGLWRAGTPQVFHFLVQDGALIPLERPGLLQRVQATPLPRPIDPIPPIPVIPACECKWSSQCGNDQICWWYRFECVKEDQPNGNIGMCGPF